jgi:hypothetical protein
MLQLEGKNETSRYLAPTASDVLTEIKAKNSTHFQGPRRKTCRHVADSRRFAAAEEDHTPWPVDRSRQGWANGTLVLDKGDVLLVTRLDRLARSTLDLLNTLEQITKRKAGFRSPADAWADTTTPHGKLMITILGCLTEFERTLILARTNEGRQRAMAKGVKFGRKPKLTEYQIDEAQRRLEACASQSEVGRLFGRL